VVVVGQVETTEEVITVQQLVAQVVVEMDHLQAMAHQQEHRVKEILVVLVTVLMHLLVVVAVAVELLL
jgi:hypothetical protein